MMGRFSRVAGLVCIVGALAACGGGSGGGDSLYDPDDGDGGGTEVTADNLDLAVNKFTISNAGSDTVTITATALDGSSTVSGVPVTITATSGLLTATDTVTGTSGSVTATLSVGSDPSNRSITITAELPDGTTKTEIVEVVGSTLTATLVPNAVTPGGAGRIEYRVVNQAGTAVPRQPYTIEAPGFTPSSASGETGTSGEFSFAYTAAPRETGNQDVTVRVVGVEDVRSVLVRSSNTAVDEVEDPILSASVSANPSVISVNAAGSTSSRSEIRALFLTSNNRPLKNVRVRFDIDESENAVGGSLNTGETLTYTDDNGIATAAYIAGSRFSPTDGVTIRACYSERNFSPPACPKEQSVSLTVANDPLGVSIGSNAEIIDNDLSYIKQFIVSVVDSSGAAKAGVALTASIDLPRFRKGFYSRGTDGWVYRLQVSCPKEDANDNGVLETGEDDDNDNRLEPGIADVSVRLLQSQTRDDGTAIVQIQYAKSFGSWVEATITVAASGVAGSEGRTSTSLVTPVSSEEVSDIENTPSFAVSPYGQQAPCSNRN